MGFPGDSKDKQALDYHAERPAGKIEVVSTKPCLTATDLSLAYSPGVAAPCREIAKNPEDVFKYTAKGNLVAVISNGTAVLGLGNIGPLAGKPVMEGKGVLFKRFADIDVFDIEIDEETVEGMVKVVSALGPTFGGINLEDIKAPECFEIETQLIEKMNIPVFHDDQHGTAIIASAAFLNALEIANKKIAKVRVVFSGAGAASIACAKLLLDLGVKKENLYMCDSKGVIHADREDHLNQYKEQFALKTKYRTLADALDGADAFIGCSARGVLSKEMVKTMAKNPIIFAMANPEPEIFPDEVFEVRKDAIMATGRSDFPNQVNNVLGFPYIFRGALDVRATKINTEMKMAAVKALATLAKEDVPDEVKLAYNNQDFSFGRNYLIPKPFDRRVLTRVTPAVAKAAMDSGVAKHKIANLTEYARQLEERMGTAAAFTKGLRDGLRSYVAQRSQKVKMVFCEGSNARILQACDIIAKEDVIEPILLGDPQKIYQKMEKMGLRHLQDLTIVCPEESSHYQDFCQKFFEKRVRKGMSLAHAKDLMLQENYFGSMMIREGLADSLISGPTHTYPECFRPIMQVVGTQDTRKAAGIFILVFKNRVLFLADCTAQVKPSEVDLCDIALSTSELYRHLMQKDPRVAFLSFSNFGSNPHPDAKKVARAVSLTKEKSWLL